MDFHFSEEHQKAIGDDTAAQGFPDDGNGRYTQKKLYPEWYFMNIARRQRFNGHDALVTMAPLSLANGLFLPYPTIGLVGAYSLGRYLYTQGYLEKEGANNNMRVSGAVLCHTTTLATMLVTLYIGSSLARGRIPQIMKRAAF